MIAQQMTNKKKILATTAAHEKNRNQQQAYKKAIASQVTTIYEDHPYPTISRMTTEAMTNADTRKYKPIIKTTTTAPKTKTKPTIRTRIKTKTQAISYKAFVVFQAIGTATATATTITLKTTDNAPVMPDNDTRK